MQGNELKNRMRKFMENTQPESDIEYQNKWIKVQIIKVKTDEGIMPYTTIMDGNGNGVGVLPYRVKEDGSLEYMVRKEITPPWNYNLNNPQGTLIMSAITGGMEDDESPIEAATRELLEESGLAVSADDFESIGAFRSMKVSQNKIHLFLVDLTGSPVTELKGEGDGTYFERMAKTLWVDSVDESPHTQLHLMVEKVKNKLRK